VYFCKILPLKRHASISLWLKNNKESLLKMKKWCSAIFITIILTAGLLANSNGNSNSNSKKYVLRIGIDSFPASLNPVHATTETSQAIINKVFDSLFYFNYKGEISNGLAKDLYLYKNGREILIQLKENIFFSDGKELETDDVIQTVKLLQNKAFGYPYISDLRFIEKIEKKDRSSFKIKLKSMFAPWKNRLTFKILNSHEIQDATPAAFPGIVLSGTGPYKIKTIKKPEKIILELNGNHNSRHMDHMYRFIEYIVVSYTHLMPLKLLNNEIDIGELQPEHASAYQGIPKWQQRFKVLKYKKFGYTYLVSNLRNSTINKNLRKFFYNLLIKGDFLDRFLKNRGERVNTPFLLLNPKIQPKGFKTTPLKQPVRLKMLTNAESKLRKELVLFLRKELKTHNINLEPVFLEYHSFLEYLKKGRFDMAISGFILDIDYDITDIFCSRSFFNYANYHCPEMEALLAQGLKEPDHQKREEIYMKAHRLWREELPLIPLFNLYYYVGISGKITIPKRTYTLVGAVGDFLFNIHDWKTKN
jgi:peptide/nickel transport system substrate-binding protein